ncbi:MAG: hypothetical protein AB1689_16800, partial [Thermodesulfobacteriota bacterium]
MYGFDARRVLALVVGWWCWGVAANAQAFAPTLSGEPAWGDGTMCRRLRAGASEMVDVKFSSPGTRKVAGVHLRFEPRNLVARDADRFVVRLESDAGGLPSGQAIAQREFGPTSSPWVFVPLGNALIGSEDYHLTISAAPDGGNPKSRLCFMKHTQDPPSGAPWSATLRSETTLQPLQQRGPTLEPVFVLQFADGSLWGQPYHDVDQEPISTTKAPLSWSFTPRTDTTVTWVVARLDVRNRGVLPRFRMLGPSGAEVGSGTFAQVARSGEWSPAYRALAAPAITLRAGVEYRLMLDVPAGSDPSKYVHRTPVTDFVGSLPQFVARQTNTPAERYRVPSVRFVTAAPAPSEPNMAPNPSFEADPAPDYFTHADAPAETTFTRGADAYRSGARSVKITSKQAAGKLSRWLSRNERIQAKPGRSYSASFWLKTAGVAHEASVALNFWDGSAWTHLATRSSVTRVSGTSDWTRVQVSGTAPAGTAYVRVAARLDGPGTLWADDVVLTEVDSGDPVPAPTPGVEPTPKPTAKPTPKPTVKPTPTP